MNSWMVSLASDELMVMDVWVKEKRWEETRRMENITEISNTAVQSEGNTQVGAKRDGSSIHAAEFGQWRVEWDQAR